MSEMQISSGYAKSLIEIIAQIGWPESQQLNILEISKSDLEDPKFRVCANKFNALFISGAEALNDPLLGLRTGHQFRVASFVETGRVLAMCRNIAEAAHINIRYQPLVETIGQCEYLRETNAEFLAWKPRFGQANTYRHLTELIFGGYATTVRWLAWSLGEGVKQIEFQHSAGAPASLYSKILSCPVKFGRPANRLQFSKGIADKALPTSHPAALEKAKAELDKKLLGRHAPV